MDEQPLEQSRRFHWIGWDTPGDSALLLIAPHGETPTIWYNRRHVRSLPVGMIELWAERRLKSGQRVAAQTALDLAALVR